MTDYEESTQLAWDEGRKRGREEMQAQISNFLLVKAGEWFQRGMDDRAIWLRDVSQEVKSIKP